MIDDFLDALAEGGDPSDPREISRIWELSAAFFAANGFDKMIYIDARPNAFTMMTTLPEAWLDRYREQDYARIDPFFSHCCTTLRPVSTGVAYAEAHAGLSRDQMDLIREASEFGINAGFSSTERLVGPDGVAGWNIGSSLSRTEVDALRAEREHMLRLAARHVHDMLASARTAASPRLSPREIQCLSFLAQGQRTKDIARLLALSPGTVELYIRNAREKLGGATREQAVAIAAAQGVLRP
jgi:DNA-binding CsgD family transcriptional regulator